MHALRLWSTRHARGLETAYRAFEAALATLSPLLRRIGHRRLERPAAALEKMAKGLLFDCRMCGSCVLSSTGMTCPMNCPKELRNGPCGGVRADGACEIRPEMRCVWVEAWKGSRRMRQGRAAFASVAPPLDRSIAGTSSWLRHLREREGARP